MSEIRIAITNANPEKLFYVVSNFAIVDIEKKAVLLIKRGAHEKVYPGKWAFPGGKLEHKSLKEMIKQEGVDPLTGVEGVLGKLATQETQEEAGLIISDVQSHILKDKAFIRPDEVPVFMVTTAVRYAGGDIVLEDGIEDYSWVTEVELNDYDCIPGIHEEVIKALKSFAD